MVANQAIHNHKGWHVALLGMITFKIVSTRGGFALVHCCRCSFLLFCDGCQYLEILIEGRCLSARQWVPIAHHAAWTTCRSDQMEEEGE